MNQQGRNVNSPRQAEKQIVKQEWNSQEVVKQEWNSQEPIAQIGTRITFLTVL
jgi:hypothetical protein